MHTVNRFESNLLKILYGILERAPAAQTLPLILRAFSDGKPKCLSRTCVDLVQDALRKGCVSLLTKWGGWQNESFLRNGAESKGRVWERTLPEDLGLSFSAATLDLLIWLTAAETGDSNVNWAPQDRGNITVGDRFFFFLVFKLLQDKLVLDRLSGKATFSQNGLICLAFPDQLAGAKKTMQPDFQPWVTGTGGTIIEMMQGPLVEFWAKAESNKPYISNRQKMQRLGEAQTTVLNEFVNAAVEAGRVDLFRFMLDMMNQLVLNKHAADWTRGLNVKNLRVADRTKVYRAALAVPLAAQHLARQQQENVNVSFVDDNYEASQLWKKNWEAFNGAQSVLQAERIVAEISF